ncbi:MAG: arsenate reductase (glutaredoxin) [Alphaproteobacteria bacterium]|nr:arsenate reductase (glutaredoxin) [Alphaproteobacteria bacterium]
MSVTIYHNPRCSKSRQTLQLLADKGIEPEIVEYLNTPPDAATLDEFLVKLGMEPRDLMRKKEEPYKALNLADESLNRAALIAAMVENPILIERRGGQPVIEGEHGDHINRRPRRMQRQLLRAQRRQPVMDKHRRQRDNTIQAIPRRLPDNPAAKVEMLKGKTENPESREAQYDP